MFQDTSATRRVFQLTKRIRAVAGGTSASKTISILVWLIDYAQTNNNELITVVSETYPHLSDGAIRDFQLIMKDRGYWSDDNWHDTKHEYAFHTGSKIEFRAIDTYGKAHGPRRDILFINECNNLDYKIADQLMTRTRKLTWLDWNPTHEFWFYTELIPHRDDIDFITLTYKDNEALDPVVINEIESHRHNKQWWRVYGEGQLGEIDSRIYTGWGIIDEIPHEAKLERRGLDFGYSNDPAALLDIYKYNGGIILDERFYQKGMSNRAIAEYLKNCEDPQTLVYADSSEPKSIDEIATYGVPIIGANKGPGSVNQGIAYVQDQRISVTKRSVNLIKEYRNYLWIEDKDGTILNKPEDINNHLMDAMRYGLESFVYSFKREAGIVTPHAFDTKPKSFIVNENGEAEAYHIDPKAIAASKQEDNRDWMYR